MISILVSLLVFILVIGLIVYLLRMLPIDEQFKNIAIIIVVLIALLYLLAALTGYGPAVPRLR